MQKCWLEQTSRCSQFLPSPDSAAAPLHRSFPLLCSSFLSSLLAASHILYPILCPLQHHSKTFLTCACSVILWEGAIFQGWRERSTSSSSPTYPDSPFKRKSLTCRLTNSLNSSASNRRKKELEMKANSNISLTFHWIWGIKPPKRREGMTKKLPHENSDELL